MDHRDLPPSAFDPAPAQGRSIALWTPDRNRGWAPPLSGAALAGFALGYAPHAAVLTVALVLGFGAATWATAPAMTDQVYDVMAIDARGMGLAANLDAAGQQKQAAALGRDVSALKNEINRLQRALKQSKTAQASLAKAAAGQDDVKALKAEIAGLQKNLDATRESAAARIEALSSKLEQPKAGEDAARIAELRERLDRIEQRPAPRETASAQQSSGSKWSDGPETTGSISPSSGGIVRNWAVRDVYEGIARIESRQGALEVIQGAPVPGVGRVSSIERRGGQWVVVTDGGTILPRP